MISWRGLYRKQEARMRVEGGETKAGTAVKGEEGDEDEDFG